MNFRNENEIYERERFFLPFDILLCIALCKEFENLDEMNISRKISIAKAN